MIFSSASLFNFSVFVRSYNKLKANLRGRKRKIEKNNNLIEKIERRSRQWTKKEEEKSSFRGFLGLKGKTKSLDEKKKKRMGCMCILEGELEGKMKSLFSG